MFNLDDEDEPDRDRGAFGDMSVLDKMKMWNSNSAQKDSVVPYEDLFEGVGDHEEDEIDQSALSAYHKIILSSPAYEWFIATVAKESVLRSETDHQRIRRHILDKLPTGIISKRRTPDMHQVMFKLEWHHSMNERLRCELSENLLPVQPHRPSIIMTGSTQEAQGLTIKQYLAQTWPITGLQILEVLHTAVTRHTQQSYGRSQTPCHSLCHAYGYIVSHVGNTQLQIETSESHLLVTATGPAYFVADCGEQLAWIGSALLCSNQTLGSHCLPLITSFEIESILATPPCIKYKGHCNINFEFTRQGASDNSLPGTLNFGQELLRRSTLVVGFPIRRRPEGYSGLELSFDALLGFLQASRAELSPTHAFVKGPKNTLVLIKHTENMFLWKLDPSSMDYSLSCAGRCVNADVEEGSDPLEYHVLEIGRHVISQRSGDTVPSKCAYIPLLNQELTILI